MLAVVRSVTSKIPKRVGVAPASSILSSAAVLLRLISKAPGVVGKLGEASPVM